MSAAPGLGRGFALWAGDAPAFLDPHYDGRSIDERFAAFHKANPWVYAALVKLARSYVARGYDRVGIKMLFEVLRWQWQLAVVDTGEAFRLNNSFTSRYARLIADTEPDLATVFEQRALRAA